MTTDTSVQICESCRKTRLVLMVLLIGFAALAGYHWGTTLENGGTRIYAHDMIILAGLFTVLTAVTALWVEALVTKAEKQVEVAHAVEEQKTEEVSVKTEHLRELERIIGRITDDNATLKDMLISRRLRETAERMAEQEDAAAGTRQDLMLRQTA